MSETDLYVAVDDHTFDHNGLPVVIHAGDVVRAGNKIMRGRQANWVPLQIILAHDDDLPPSYAKIIVLGAGELESSAFRRWFPVLGKAPGPAPRPRCGGDQDGGQRLINNMLTTVC